MRVSGLNRLHRGNAQPALLETECKCGRHDGFSNTGIGARDETAVVEDVLQAELLKYQRRRLSKFHTWPEMSCLVAR